jgi:hypothetical protein
MHLWYNNHIKENNMYKKKTRVKKLLWLTQKGRTNMNLLIKMIAVKAKELGLQNSANKMSNMERRSIAVQWCGVMGYGEECIDAVRQQIDWALTTQPEENVYFDKRGKASYRGCLKHQWHYRNGLDEKGINVEIDDNEEQKRKKDVCERRKVIKKFKKEK